MPGQTLTPVPGAAGPAKPVYHVRPLPAGIPILPGRIKAKRRLPVGLIVLLVIAGLVALGWFNISSSNDDKNRIDPVVTQAMFAHVAKGTGLPITLKSGPRVLQIGNANVTYQGQSPTTCVQVKILDPKTGAEDTKSPYVGLTCIEGLKYPIH